VTTPRAKKAVATLVDELNDAFAFALKTLLEDKHLYQSVSIDIGAITDRWRDRMTETDLRMLAAAGGTGVSRLHFLLSDSPLRSSDPSGTLSGVPTILVQNVKLYCGPCEGREVFAPVWFRDIEREVGRQAISHAPGRPVAGGASDGPTQVIAIGLRCQRCLGDLNVAVVRRSAWKLILEGRSPMEHVEVPKFIPKTESHLYRDAVIATNAGKTLAALFYLRTFIEQFARRRTGLRGKETGETIMNAYSKTLPLAQRDSMPSLGEWYDKLSGALHSAHADADLLTTATVAIDQHFDIRRVFRMEDTG
jgi:hypothetical protein